MKASDLIDILIEEASHRIINDERAKNSNHALMASGKKGGMGKSKQKKDGDKEKTDELELTARNWVTNNLNAVLKVVEKKAKVLGKRSQLKLKRPLWLSQTVMKTNYLLLHALPTM